MRYDYTTIGHVTVDELADGERRPGGGAFYSALQASRLGLRTLVLTRGVPAELEELLSSYTSEIDVRVEAAPATTVLATAARTGPRRQRVTSWAGPLPGSPAVESDIVHFAPVAAECPTGWSGEARFVAFTPQGVARSWGDDGVIQPSSAPSRYDALARRCAAVVLNARELPRCAELVAAAREGGAVVAVTDESGPNLLIGDAAEVRIAVPPVTRKVDDLGAGDVYAAAFFCELAAGAAPSAAAAFANGAAALRIAGLGAGAIASRAAIERARAGSSALR